MKKVIVFMFGFITAVIVLGVVGYFLLKDRTTVSMGNSVQHEIAVIDAPEGTITEISAMDFEDLKQNTHKKTLINFWASWCKPCVDEIPILIDYGKKNDINLIFISADKNNEKQKELLKKQMSKLNLKNTYIIKETNISDLTGRGAYYEFLDEIKIDYNKQETGIPFFILINENGEYSKAFNGPDKTSLYSAYYNRNIKN